MPGRAADSIRSHVAARLAALLAPGTRICAGFSGGLDSTVLLDVLASLRGPGGIELTAVHVNHGLSPQADAWSRACAEFCAARDVPLAVERVQVDRDSPLGIEAAARETRHAVFAACDADVVALAHHLDDQAETVLLQLLRGTGIKGASAMPEFSPAHLRAPAIFRPLLALPREALLDHAQAQGLGWVEDESNAATRFDRNFLRLEVAPLMAQRFPQWRESLARFARHAASAEQLLGALAHIDGACEANGLPLGPLRGLSRERQANALRAFIDLNGLPMPGEARLAEMRRQLLDAPPDSQVRLVHEGVALVRHRDVVRVDSPARDVATDPAWRLPWRGQPEIELGPGRGAVRFVEARGLGIDARHIGEAGEGARGWHFASRAGGERLQLDARRPSRSLKNLLQENAVPAWQRARLPLLFHGDRLVWVPGIGIALAYQCPSGTPGRVPEWQSGARELAAGGLAVLK